MLRLELEKGPAIDLDDTPLVHITEVDFGFPEVRDVVDNRPQADGSIDRTQFFGSRVVTLTGKLAIDWQARQGLPRQRQEVMDRLAPFLRPDVRPWLYSRFDDGRVRRILLRPDQFSRPQIANVQDLTVSFKSPTGVFEDDPAHEVRVVPEVQVQGRVYDLEFDRVYPEGSGTWITVTNAGNAPADWTARIFGSCGSPAVENVTTGELVSLQGLAVPAGHFVEIDSREHTVFADGLPEASRWHAVDYVATTWWRLPPGRSNLRFRVEWFDVPSAMLFAWRDTSLL